nr:NSP1 [Bat RVJ-like rotavirus BtSY1]
MLSTLRTFRESRTHNDAFDFLTDKELWHGKFDLRKAKDAIPAFKGVDYTKYELKHIQYSKSTQSGTVMHVKQQVSRKDMEKLEFSGQYIHLSDLCGRKDEHFCGALHDIHTNETDYSATRSKRPQIVSPTTVFFPCGAKFIVLKEDDGDKLIVGTKFRTCSCGNQIVTAASTNIQKGYQYISYCCNDILTATVNPERKSYCKCCGEKSSAYEANFATWQNGYAGEEHMLRENLCHYCAPIKFIFCALLRNGYTPKTSSDEFMNRSLRWQRKKFIQNPPSEYEFKIANHRSIANKLKLIGVNNDEPDMTVLKNSMWMRDLTRENVESNPGPAPITESVAWLNEHSQKMQVMPPLYTFEKVIIEEEEWFVCHCSYMIHYTSSRAKTKNQAKRQVAQRMIYEFAKHV